MRQLSLELSSQLALFEAPPTGSPRPSPTFTCRRKLARASSQLALMEVPPCYAIASNAHARNAYGAAAQEIVCAALGLSPIPIDGGCEVCFDAEGAGEFFEIKSVHRGAKVVVYDWRMRKESAAGVPLKYAILCHNVRGARDGSRLFEAMAAGGLSLLVLEAATVHEAAALEPLCTIKRLAASPRAGYNRKGYLDGYRNVSVHKLASSTSTREPRAFELFGVPFAVEVLR